MAAFAAGSDMQMPSDAQVRAQQQQDASGLSMPSDAQIRAKMAEKRQAMTDVLSQKIDPVKPGTFKTVVPDMHAPPPVHKPSLDDVLAQYNQVKDGHRPYKPGTDLLIFVSFSMPKDKLMELARQAKETGAVMIVRGFKNGSLLATKQAAFDVNQHAKVAWEINPNLFKAFQIKAVPAFVIANSHAEDVLDNGCSPDATYSSVSGDISVEIALEELRLHAQPEIAKEASKRLDDLHARAAHQVSLH
ncbi:TPA: type-F conjugative transfer system pilin assembly protein TrbC [Burkholderia lata]